LCEVPDNGPELLSAIITGVPEDTVFSAGSNIGNRTWVIPVEDLPTLQITPPQYYAGVMNLTLTALTFESSTGEEGSVSASFDVNIAAVPDPFLILAFDVELDNTGLQDSPLALRILDNRTTIEPGEILNEYIQVTYSGLPEGVRVVPEKGGRLIDDGGGQFTFIGTGEQANSLRVSTGPNTPSAGVDVLVSGVTIDDGVVLPTAITDTFRLVTDADTDSESSTAVQVIINGTITGNDLNGTEFNDVLNGNEFVNILRGNGGDDVLIGGPGADVMNGGSGVDMFKWTNLSDFTGSTFPYRHHPRVRCGRRHHQRVRGSEWAHYRTIRKTLTLINFWS
jgi:hypothetical protein